MKVMVMLRVSYVCDAYYVLLHLTRTPPCLWYRNYAKPNDAGLPECASAISSYNYMITRLARIPEASIGYWCVTARLMAEIQSQRYYTAFPCWKCFCCTMAILLSVGLSWIWYLRCSVVWEWSIYCRYGLYARWHTSLSLMPTAAIYFLLVL